MTKGNWHYMNKAGHRTALLKINIAKKKNQLRIEIDFS